MPNAARFIHQWLPDELQSKGLIPQLLVSGGGFKLVSAIKVL
jgi:hypothetical protein